MSIASVAAPSRFRMEEALQATFEAVFANLGVFVPLALVLSAAPNFIVQMAFPIGLAGANSGLFVAGILVKPVVGLACAALLQGALTRGTVDHLNGVKPRFSICLRAGLSAGAALVGIGLLFGIAVVAGLVFLIAPGLFLVALWAPAGAVAVVERRGVFASFGRAGDLTRGDRWAVLIVMVVVAVLGFVLSAVVSTLVGLVTAGMGGPLALAGALGSGGAFTPMLLVVALVSALSVAAASILTNAAPAAIYYGLRRSKEGAGPAELAALFD